MSEFPSSEPVDVEIFVPVGSVTVIAEERDSVHAEVTPQGNGEASRSAAEATNALFENGTLLIELPMEHRRGSPPAIHVEARVPADSRIRIRVASAHVDCRGQYGEAEVHSASGNVAVGDVTGHGKIHTASGEVRIGAVGGDLSVNSASGDIAAGVVSGSVEARTASGDLKVRSVGGNLSVQTASGDVEVGGISRGETIVKTVSGKVDIAVARGTGVWLDLSSMSGKITSDLETDDSSSESRDLSIHARTVSGRISIDRAAQTVNA